MAFVQVEPGKMTSRAAFPGEDAQSGRVLIVEDDFIQATESEATLRDAGFIVVAIVKAMTEAVACARAERPDLVLMDIRLFGPREGIDAALAIYWATGIRCIFASAHADPRTRAVAAPARPLGWLQKPFTPAALSAAVRRALAELRDAA